MVGKNSRFLGAGGLLLGALLGGCASHGYRPAPLDPAAGAQAFGERRLSAPALGEFAARLRGEDWSPTSWDADALFTAALFYRSEFAVARAEWRARRADVVTAARRPPLGISLQSQHHSETPDGDSPWTIGALLDFLIPGPGQRQARIDVAQARAAAGRWALGQTAWRIREQVYRRYLALFGLGRRVRLFDRERAVLAEASDLLERRQELGAAGGLAVTSMRLRRQRSQLALARAQSEVAAARIDLAGAVGLPVSALNETGKRVSEPHRRLPQLGYDEVRAAGLQSRYDLRRALAEYAEADARLRGGVAAQYPEFTLSPGFLFDQEDRVWVLNLSWLLKLPGYQDGPIAAARARRDAAAARFRGLQARIIGQLDAAIATYRGRLQLLAAAEQILAAQRAHEAQVQARFDAGYSDRLALLRAQIESLVARRARLGAWIGAHKALVGLETAAQTSFGSGEIAAVIDRFVARGTEQSTSPGGKESP